MVVGNDWSAAQYMQYQTNDQDHLTTIGQMRLALFDEFPVHVQLDFWLVHPNLEVDEQDGFRDRYVLVDYSCPDDQIAIVVVVADPEDADMEKLAIRVRPQMTDRLLYIQIGKTVKCTSEEFECSAEHNGRILPTGSYWPTFHGMKIRVNIREIVERCRRRSNDSEVSGHFPNRQSDRVPGVQLSTDSEEHSLMQFFTDEEMQIVEVEPVARATFAQSYMEVVLIDPEHTAGSDLLRTYIHDRKGETAREAFTIYVWMLQSPHVSVAHTAQRCACVKDRSYTEALLRLWTVSFPVQPLAVTLVHPDLQPLSLRAVPVDLIVVPECDISSGKRVFLVDVVGMPMPRRLATFVDGTTLVKDIATSAGARLICDLPTTRCTLHSAAPHDRQIWGYEQIVTAEHGSGLVLWIEPVTSRRMVHMMACDDSNSLMQLAPLGPESSLKEYMHAATEIGFMHLWVHDSSQPEQVQCNHKRVNWPRPRTKLELSKSNWMSREDEQQWNSIPIRPLPVMGGARQPTIIFYREAESGLWPILIQAKRDLGRQIGAMVLYRDLGPFAVRYLLEMMIPNNRCERDRVCLANLDGDFYRFWVDVPLYPGAFVEIVELEADTENSTTCSDSEEESEEATSSDDDILEFTQL